MLSPTGARAAVPYRIVPAAVDAVRRTAPFPLVSRCPVDETRTTDPSLLSPDHTPAKQTRDTTAIPTDLTPGESRE